jgi:glucose/arabinose dehydrogenase
MLGNLNIFSSKFFVFLILFIIIINGSYNFAEAQKLESLQVDVETVAENLEIPWAISFAPDGRIFFTERVGNLRVIENGQLNLDPVTSIDVGSGEGGLLGLALDPSFEQNHYLYLYYTYFEFPFTYNKVVRYTEKDNALTDEIILVDKIPGAAWHDGGRLKFGPDEKLYITTGDAGNADSAQDLNSLGGKILRINPDGTVPSDNPFSDSLIFSYGHRNPQGIDWDPVTGKLVISEHGPSGERGFAHDEINVIEPGKNYGWPKVIGDEQESDLINPILHTGDETWAPSGASFYDSNNIPEWENKYFVATLRGTHLRMLDLDLEENQVISSEVILSNLGRLRDVSMGPDGSLYIMTSNRDGRGAPAENDDRILRIVPVSFDNRIIFDRPPVPLKQFEMGIEPRDVKCKLGFELIIKSSNGMPACVLPDSASKLVSKGWGMWP